MTSNNFKTSSAGVALIKRCEGCEKRQRNGTLKAYLCPAGVWTIGYGHTEGVTPDLVINQTQADALLGRDLRKFEDAVNSAVRVALNQNMFDALVSFTYNVGVKALNDSTLLKLLNQRKYAAAADQFKRWNKSNGRVLQGLIDRRAAEAALFAAR